MLSVSRGMLSQPGLISSDSEESALHGFLPSGALICLFPSWISHKVGPCAPPVIMSVCVCLRVDPSQGAKLPSIGGVPFKSPEFGGTARD